MDAFINVTTQISLLTKGLQSCQCCPHLSSEINQNPSQPPQEQMKNLEETMVELAKSQAQFMDKTKAIFQIQPAQFERLEVKMEQMTKIISNEKERSFPTFEDSIRVEVKNANELSEVGKKSTSPEPKKLEKEVKNTIPKITPLKEVHEELQSECIFSQHIWLTYE